MNFKKHICKHADMIICSDIYAKDLLVKNNDCDYEFLDFYDVQEHL